MNKFPFYKQLDSMDCGPTCLKIIAKFYKKDIDIFSIREVAQTNRSGSSILGLSNTAESLGFRTLAVKIPFQKLTKAPFPAILFWNNNHFVVIHQIKKDFIYLSDPAYGLIKYSKNEFLNCWCKENTIKEEGIALLIEPTPNFHSNTFTRNEKNKTNLSLKIISTYLLRYKNLVWQLILGLFIGSVLQLILPFLTQTIVDVGIQNQDLNFIYLILIAQLFIFIGRMAIEVVRGWILLHLSTRINISLISDFFIKLMKLPISYFDTRMTGDIMQRINDHKRIERLLTTSSLTTIFSLFNIIILGIVLAYYDILIFLIFFCGSCLYFGWVLLFFKKREDLDYKRFTQMSQESSKVIELINGMQEIKLHNAEKQKRWGWENLQAKLFKLSILGLSLEQYQSVGSNFINELKNILIIFTSAKLVIQGEITLGMMLAISYIVGQLNSPVSQIINFLRELQDARISLARLSEIHQKEEEDNSNKHFDIDSEDYDFKINNISFNYPGINEKLFDGLNLVIPANKITAIVGTSGSGKTSLLKLLMKFYTPTTGIISYGSQNIDEINHYAWRNHFGVVMQEGYIFNDSILNNIAVGVDYIEDEKIKYAVQIANIQQFIEGLPQSYNTLIGSEGIGISTGQKQRILIARSVYKNPKILFFDEATSALDSSNEKIIMENLNIFFKNKTVIIIAHRLSTVKNADQIVVMDEGKIVEKGTHTELVKKNKYYFELVKNQLELGS